MSKIISGWHPSIIRITSSIATTSAGLFGNLSTTAHQAARCLGLIAIGALGVMFVRPVVIDDPKPVSPTNTLHAQQAQTSVAQATPTQSTASRAKLTSPEPKTRQTRVAPPFDAKTELLSSAVKTDATQRQQQWVANWLSKRYRVAGDAVNMLVSAAYSTARDIKLDPLLILAVMAIESGLNPFAESPGGAQGLMQVMSKVHHDKFNELGGIKAALNPVANIRVGSLILKDYVTRGGSLEAGLKMYVGAATFDNDSGYGSRVLAEYRHLKDVATGKKVAISSTTASAAPIKPNSALPVTVVKPDLEVEVGPETVSIDVREPELEKPIGEPLAVPQEAVSK